MSPELVHNSIGNFTFIDGDKVEKINVVYIDNAGNPHQNLLGEVRLHEVIDAAAQGLGITYRDLQIKLLSGEKTISW